MAEQTNRIPYFHTQQNSPAPFLEQHIQTHHQQIEDWFSTQWPITHAPFYSSVDCRNAGFKAAPIDTNIFPAGWNNLDPNSQSLCVNAAKATVSQRLPNAKRLMLIPENHSRNLAYFNNVKTLQQILSLAGFEVIIGTTDPQIETTRDIQLADNESITLHRIHRQNNTVKTETFLPCGLILNNDLSSGHPDILRNLSQTILPLTQFGWHQRLKSEHFYFYQQAANELAQLINIDPWLINPLFDQCPEVDFMKPEGRHCIEQKTELLFQRIQQKYNEHRISQPPFIVIKADQGTYGMAVMTIRSMDELRSLNRKQRTRMSHSKGSRMVTRAIIQEGIYSVESTDDGAATEPTVYHFGHHVVGGFYRSHPDKGSDEILNTPGMNFTPLTLVDNPNEPYPHRFYLYSVISRLAVLAAARELHAFQGDKP